MELKYYHNLKLWSIKVINKISNIPQRYYKVGFDFGFEKSYNALLRLAIDHENKYLYIYWEYYKNQTTDDVTVKDIKEFKDTQELIKLILLNLRL